MVRILDNKDIDAIGRHVVPVLRDTSSGLLAWREDVSEECFVLGLGFFQVRLTHIPIGFEVYHRNEKVVSGTSEGYVFVWRFCYTYIISEDWVQRGDKEMLLAAYKAVAQAVQGEELLRNDTGAHHRAKTSMEALIAQLYP